MISTQTLNVDYKHIKIKIASKILTTKYMSIYSSKVLDILHNSSFFITLSYGASGIIQSPINVIV